MFPNPAIIYLLFLLTSVIAAVQRNTLSSQVQTWERWRNCKRNMLEIVASIKAIGSNHLASQIQNHGQNAHGCHRLREDHEYLRRLPNLGREIAFGE